MVVLVGDLSGAVEHAVPVSEGCHWVSGGVASASGGDRARVGDRRVLVGILAPRLADSDRPFTDLPTREDPSGELPVSQRDDLPPHAGGAGDLLHPAHYPAGGALDRARHRAWFARDLRRRARRASIRRRRSRPESPCPSRSGSTGARRSARPISWASTASRSLLLVLTTLISVVSIIWSWDTVNTRAREYYIAILLLETGMLGVFVALDMFLFYIFWELMLIPMALLIGIWGSTEPGLRRGEVLPLHPLRLAADAGRHRRHLLGVLPADRHPHPRRLATGSRASTAARSRSWSS